MVQKNAKRLIVRIQYLRKLDLISRLQRVGRQKMGVRKLEIARQTKAVVKIQAEWRRYNQRKRFLRQCAFIVQLQTASRSYIMRRKFVHIRQHLAATKIQSLLRGWAVRKQYLAKRNYMIRVQACIRRRLAHKKLLMLKEGARSTERFKDVPYSLENKMDEVTRHVSQNRDEKDQMRVKTKELEVQVNSWIDKYDTIDKKAKDIETKFDKPSGYESELASMKHQHSSLKTDYDTSIDRINKQNSEIARLGEDLNRQKEEIFRLKRLSNPRHHKPYTGADDGDVAELKSQIMALKSQLSQSLKQYPKYQSSINTNNNPQRNGRRGRSADPRLAMAPARTGKKIIYAEPKQMIPKKVGQPVNLDMRNPEAAMAQLLRNNGEVLENELVQGLIHTLRIVPPGTHKFPAREEVFYPTHIIGKYVTQMWRLGYLLESERLLFRVMGTVQQECAV